MKTSYRCAGEVLRARHTQSQPWSCAAGELPEDVLAQKSEERNALNSDFTACSKLLRNLLKNQSGCWMKGYADSFQIFLDPYLVTSLHSLI